MLLTLHTFLKYMQIFRPLLLCSKNFFKRYFSFIKLTTKINGTLTSFSKNPLYEKSEILYLSDSSPATSRCLNIKIQFFFGEKSADNFLLIYYCNLGLVC